MPDMDRRAVVRSATWAVPVVAVAAAAPAFATSGSNLSTSTIGPIVTVGSGSNRFTNVTVTIINSGTGPTTALRATIALERDVRPQDQVAPVGWTVSYDPATWTLTYTSATQLAAGATRAVIVTIRPGNNSALGAVVALDPGGGGLGRTFPRVIL